MSNSVKWLLTILFLTAYATSLFFFSSAYKQFQIAIHHKKELQNQLAALKKQLKKLKSNPEKVKRWKATIQKLENAHLHPDHWLKYPFIVDQDITWNQLANIAFIVSAGHPYGQKYLFVPESFVLIKKDTSDSSSDVTGQKNSQSSNAQKPAQDNSQNELYSVKLKGTFLVKKTVNTASSDSNKAKVSNKDEQQFK